MTEKPNKLLRILTRKKTTYNKTRETEKETNKIIIMIRKKRRSENTKYGAGSK